MGTYKYFFSEPKENEILETIFFFLCNLFTMRIICAILKKNRVCIKNNFHSVKFLNAV